MKHSRLFHRGGRSLQGVICLALMGTSATAAAAIPSGYYNNVDTSSPAALRNTLHEIIDDHQRFPYTSSSTDTWDILEAADEDPNNSSNVIDVYKNASYTKAGGGNSFYNREHSWPKSYGFPNDGSSNYPYTDAHHLFISDSSYNSSRSNKPYANCTSGCSEKTTLVNHGRGGSGQSNWTAGSYENGSWQTWDARKGDVARALMYLAVRYEGGSHGTTGHSEPDLILTDDRNLIGNSKTGSNGSTAYMGLKSVLIQWHKDDPVDAFETRRNDTIYTYQGNRNPFIDHPEYVACVFENNCSGGGGGGGDTTAPAKPNGLSANGGNGSIALSWSANSESDLSGYNVYRSTTSGGTYTKINSSTISSTSYTDSGLAASTTYYYQIKAVDNAGNLSTASSTASATTQAGGGSGGSSTDVWINELHYDNSGTDTNEGVEIAGGAGVNLSGYTLVAYNGNGGSAYKTTNLSGVLANQQNGFGTKFFAISGLQNGAPDGIALVDGSGKVVQFLSYEGTMTANGGAANGMTSTNIGVSETSSTASGHSLQLRGSGSKYSDFTWASPSASSYNAVNSGQSFTGSGGGSGGGSGDQSTFTNSTVTAINSKQSFYSDLSVQRSGSAGSISVTVDIDHTYRGDISLRLYAPDGSSYLLKNYNGSDSANDINATYNVSPSGNAQGTWRLRVEDHYNGDSGQLNSWTVKFN